MASATPTTASPSSATSVTTKIEASHQACPKIPLEPSHHDLPGTNITLHRLVIYVGCLCLILSALGCLLNFCSHLIWRYNLKEQKYLMRITLLPLVYAIFAWCSVDFYGINSFMDPLPKLYEIYCLASFYSFMVQVLTPDEATRDDFFIKATRMNRRGKKQKHDNGSLRWFRFESVAIYMSLFVIFIITILQEIVNTVMCHTSRAYEILDVVIEVFSFVATVMALMALVRMYARFRKDYQGTHLLRKFWTFKGFVWLIVHQQIIIGAIQASKVVTPTRYMSFADFEYGIPEFMICCEALIFSWVYVTTLSGWSYRKAHNANYVRVSTPQQAYDASAWAYLRTVLFPIDIFTGFWNALCTCVRLPRGRKAFDYTGGTGMGWTERQGESEDHEAAKLSHHPNGSDSDLSYDGRGESV